MPQNMPYQVYGTVTLSDGSHPSGVKVVVRNDRTIQNITTTTDGSGKYLVDIANLTSGYSIGDSITVIVRDGLEEGSDSFTILSTESTQEVDITTSEILDSSDVAYCTITEVYNELDGKTSSDISANRIRDYILRAESEIDARTGTSYKSNTVTNEIYDINGENIYLSANRSSLGLARADGRLMAGARLKLSNRPVIAISSMYKNSAGDIGVDSWEALTQHTGTVAGDYTLYKNKGIIEFLQNAPNIQRRALKVTYTWGLDRTSTDSKVKRKIELVRQLAILIAVRQCLSTKFSGSQFDNVNDISVDVISIRSGAGETGYLENIKLRIDEIYALLGTSKEWSMGLEGADY